jgi:hypothetical protein
MTRRRKDCEVSTAPGSLAPHPSSLIHALIIPAWKPFNSRIPAEQGHDGHFLRYVFGLRNFTKLAHQLPSLQYATIVLPPDCLTTDTWTASSSQMSRKLIRSYRAQFAFRWRIVESFAAKLETSEFEERYGITGFERISWSEGKGYRISIRVDRENGEKQRQCELRVCAMDVG